MSKKMEILKTTMTRRGQITGSEVAWEPDRAICSEASELPWRVPSARLLPHGVWCHCTEDSSMGISGLNFLQIFLHDFPSCGRSPHIFSAVWKRNLGVDFHTS